MLVHYSGTVTTGEVETSDTAASGNSDVYAVFTVSANPVYSGQQVEIEFGPEHGRRSQRGARRAKLVAPR